MPGPNHRVKAPPLPPHSQNEGAAAERANPVLRRGFYVPRTNWTRMHTLRFLDAVSFVINTQDNTNIAYIQYINSYYYNNDDGDRPQ